MLKSLLDTTLHYTECRTQDKSGNPAGKIKEEM
jgi:hypothetical protein